MRLLTSMFLFTALLAAMLFPTNQVHASTGSLGCTWDTVTWDYYSDSTYLFSVTEITNVYCPETTLQPGEEFGGFGIGGHFYSVAFTWISNSPLTQTEAQCTSNVEDRHLHAMEDARHDQLARMATGRAWLRTGTPVRVRYDDGGFEDWVVLDPRSSANLAPVPVPNSLKCPSPTFP